MEQKLVFLGGTCNESKWRDQFKEKLKLRYFDPVVPKWDARARKKEAQVKAIADILLYVFTPKQKGWFGIAEVVSDAIRRPQKTVMCISSAPDGDDVWHQPALTSMHAVRDLVKDAGAKTFNNIKDTITYLNSFYMDIVPDPDMMECIIERDGPTEIRLDNDVYRFEENEAGHFVCRVMKDYHKRELERTGNFRVYQADRLPDPDFSPSEMAFISEWNLLGKYEFMAYLNKNIDSFIKCRKEIRDMAYKKWFQLWGEDVKSPLHMADDMGYLAKEKIRKAVVGQDTLPAGDGEMDMALQKVVESPLDKITKIKDLPLKWQDFFEEFSRLKPQQYRDWILSREREDMLLMAPKLIWDKAVAKWEKLVEQRFDLAWPYTEEIL